MLLHGWDTPKIYPIMLQEEPSRTTRPPGILHSPLLTTPKHPSPKRSNRLRSRSLIRHFREQSGSPLGAADDGEEEQVPGSGYGGQSGLSGLLVENICEKGKVGDR